MVPYNLAQIIHLCGAAINGQFYQTKRKAFGACRQTTSKANSYWPWLVQVVITCDLHFYSEIKNRKEIVIDINRHGTVKMTGPENLSEWLSRLALSSSNSTARTFQQTTTYYLGIYGVHDNAFTWRQFQHYWPHCAGIYRWISPTNIQQCVARMFYVKLGQVVEHTFGLSVFRYCNRNMMDATSMHIFPSVLCIYDKNLT